VADFVAGVAAAGVSYGVASAILAEPVPIRAPPDRSLERRAQVRDDSPRGPAERVAVSKLAPARAARPGAQATDTPESQESFKERASMNLLRNEVIRAYTEDMGRRGVSVVSCLDGVRLAGTEKIRFAVTVASSASQASTGEWRFVEIAEGEPLPESFAACATRAFGAGQRVAPPSGEQFPDYRGELMMLFTIPAAAE
jgi:hypothetical protein